MNPPQTNNSEKQKFISYKIKKILSEGIRGRAVSPKQAVAVAHSYADKKQNA